MSTSEMNDRLPGADFGGFLRAGDAGPLGRDELIACYERPERGTPWLRTNFVSSLDGAVTRDGVSGGLGTEPDHIVFELLRMLSDVVIVGAGTIRNEGYGGMRIAAESILWREQHGLSPQLPLAIVSSRLDLDPESDVFTKAAVRPIVITHEAAPHRIRARLEEVADVIVAGEHKVDLPAVVAELARRGFTQMLSEGGPHLLGSMLEADLVDELCLTVSPTLEGGDAGRISQGAAASPRPLRLAHVLTGGDTLLLRYTRGTTH